MARKKGNCYSGIGGQAVLEGIMMKNDEKYAVAVRKPSGEIEVELENYQGILHGSKVKNIPFVRGVFNFIDSMILGMRCLNFSAEFYEDEDTKETGLDRAVNRLTHGNAEKVFSALVTVFAVILALGIFVALPTFLGSLLRGYVRSDALLTVLEGLIRILIFILYVVGITVMKDIRRLYMYHGAEHKCINCLERGMPLTVRNVMRSSRLHKRCGTSFIFFVFLVSIIVFFFVQMENPFYRMIIRLLLIPVIAGISYELIRLAGRSNNIFVRLLSVPGMMIQRLTTKEPTKDMVEVAIAAVEAVYDWPGFLAENFGYEVDLETDDRTTEPED